MVAEYLLHDNKVPDYVVQHFLIEKNFLILDSQEIINKKIEHGSHSLLFNGKTAAVAWCDKKPIIFLQLNISVSQ